MVEVVQAWRHELRLHPFKQGEVFPHGDGNLGVAKLKEKIQ